MKLRVMLPQEILLEAPVRRIIAEGERGYFCILPRHVDYVSVLKPGLLSFVGEEDDREQYVALDGGTLVKCGAEVLVSTRQGVRGERLGELRRTVEEQFQVVDEMERRCRTALASLQANFIQRMMELEERG